MRETDKFVFFWGNDDIYSNFYYFPFKHRGILFKWSEQAIMYRKARLFGADRIAEKILKANTPYDCKQLGRSREIPFNQEIWEANRERIYEEVLISKFNHNELRLPLVQTMDKTIVEASPYDKIWGIGLGENDPRAEDPSKWRGLNLLGKVLMVVRDKVCD